MSKAHRSTPAARQRGFLDFSITEIVITFGVALVVLGPKKLPGLVGQIGRWMGRARVMARQFREQLEHEVNSVNSAVSVTQPTTPRPPPLSPDPPVTTATSPITPAEEAAADRAAASSGAETAAAPAAQSFHAGTPTHFTMNGTQPGVSFSNPLDDVADTTEEPVARPCAEVEATAPRTEPAQGGAAATP